MGDGLDRRTVDLDHHDIDLVYSQEKLVEATFGEVVNQVTHPMMPDDLVYRYSEDMLRTVMSTMIFCRKSLSTSCIRLACHLISCT